jgi:hypothetical protein
VSKLYPINRPQSRQTFDYLSAVAEPAVSTAGRRLATRFPNPKGVELMRDELILDLKMLKKKKVTGYWFLPTKPDEKVSGTLYFDPKQEITLDLIGAFEKRRNFFLEKDETRYVPVIYGLDSDGQKVVLIYCYRRKYSFHYRTDVSVSSFLVKSVICGDSFFNPEEAVFSQIRFSINYLNQWIGGNVIQSSISCDNNGSLTSFEFRFSKSQAVSAFHSQLNENLILTVEPRAVFYEKKPNETRIVEYFEVHFRSTRKLSFEAVRRLAVRFHSFIALAYDDPTFFSFMNVGFDKEGINGKSDVEWASVRFSQTNINRNFKRALRVRFNYGLIQNNLDSILKNWFSFDSTMDPLIERLIYSQKRSESLTSDFLTVNQGLDGFHRRYFTKNHRVYEKRLKQLVENCEGISNMNFSDSEISKIAQNRHYYTHLYDGEEGTLYTLEELDQKTQKLKALFFCCVMKKIGFSDEMLDWVGADLLIYP